MSEKVLQLFFLLASHHVGPVSTICRLLLLVKVGRGALHRIMRVLHLRLHVSIVVVVRRRASLLLILVERLGLLRDTARTGSAYQLRLLNSHILDSCLLMLHVNLLLAFLELVPELLLQVLLDLFLRHQRQVVEG